MASLEYPDLSSMLDVQDRRDQRNHDQTERLETSPSHAGELRNDSLEGWVSPSSRFCRRLTSFFSLYISYNKLKLFVRRYAAIDPGSTGTRAVIAVAKIDETTGKRKIVENGIIRIQDFRLDDDRDRRTTRGEWPSKCCPFDGPPYYIGYDADSQDEKRTISIKAIPYFRSQDDDGHPFTKALYDYSRSLPSEVERKHFDKILDTILFTFLYVLSVCLLRTSLQSLVLPISSSCPRHLRPSYISSSPKSDIELPFLAALSVFE